MDRVTRGNLMFVVGLGILTAGVLAMAVAIYPRPLNPFANEKALAIEKAKQVVSIHPESKFFNVFADDLGNRNYLVFGTVEVAGTLHFWRVGLQFNDMGGFKTSLQEIDGKPFTLPLLTR